jgi:flagellar protein FlbD
MINVTRLDGSRFVLNAELIRTVESTPDTLIKLTTGESYMVRESSDDIVRLAVEYGRLLRGLLEPS